MSAPHVGKVKESHAKGQAQAITRCECVCQSVPEACRGYCAGAAAARCTDVSDTAYAWASGTSMAVPHAAGVAAIYLSDHPTATPKEVMH